MPRSRHLAARAALLAMLSLAAGLAGAGEVRKIIIDDDGFNIAQWMIVQAPEADVLGASTVSGNVWAKAATADALRKLEIAGRSDIPVYTGATYPLLNTEARTALWEKLYGRLIWKGAWHTEWVEPTEQSLPTYHGPYEVPDHPWGNPTTEAADLIAANFMIQAVRAHPGEVSILATGPLTNLALAQRLDPELASLAKELIYMGGSLNPRQKRDSVAAEQFAREFVNSPRREFNIRFDPEAAAIALRAPWKRIVMVPVDPAAATELTPELIARISDADTLLAEKLAEAEPGFPLWDIIAAGVWLEPELITASEELFVDVNTMFGPSYGDMLSWSPGYEPGLGEQRQLAVLEIDVAALETLMVDLLTRATPGAE
jgi:inosine-uridine nucleoside N-ribohydrolase